MGRVIIAIAVVALTIYCVVDLAQSPTYKVRFLPKWLWWFVVALIPVFGPLSWLFFGRPSTTSGSTPGTRAPDDDDDFLRGLG